MEEETLDRGILVRLTRQHRNPLSVLAVLALLILGVNLVGYVAANPYSLRGFVPPDQETYPPVITIASPTNNTAYNTSPLPLTFNVTAPQSKTASSTGVDNVAYKADWRNQSIDVLQGGQGEPSFDLLLSNIPEGQHSITITARGIGTYMNEKELSYTLFFITSTATVSFTMDYTAPTVSVLPIENVTFGTDISLTFMANEPVSIISYVLDGRENLTIAENTTLSGLAIGAHNVTVYAWDAAGNVGASENVLFTVAEPEGFPTVPVVAVSTMSITAFAAGLLFYLKKCKR